MNRLCSRMLYQLYHEQQRGAQRVHNAAVRYSDRYVRVQAAVLRVDEYFPKMNDQEGLPPQKYPSFRQDF